MTNIERFKAHLKTTLIGRDLEVDLCTLALVAGEHAFLEGPPGTGKSQLINNFIKATQAKGFTLLMSPFTTPEEVFGPFMLSALQKDRYLRNLTDRICEAELVFLDEALALDTPILTTDGWKTVGDLQVGDNVFGSDGKPTEVLELTPIKHDAECFRVHFRDGESLVCDGGHLWNCRDNKVNGKQNNCHWRTLTTADMSQACDKGRKWSIPLANDVELPEADLEVDPYVLGLWLGNGNCWTGEMYIRSEWAEAVLAEIQKSMPEASLGRMVGSNLGATVINMGSTGFRTQLRLLGLINNKTVPEKYLLSSLRQRERLLQGLMDSDGYIKDGTCVFSNTNTSIVDAVLFIARSMGAIASVRKVKDNRSSTYKQCYKVTFFNPDNYQAFLCRGNESQFKRRIHCRKHLIRRIERTESVPVRCIRVAASDHLFLAGKNLVVTHNCFKSSGATLNSLLTIMQERMFDNDGKRIKCPLRSLFAASNEMPDPDANLGALYDRFALRTRVRPIPQSMHRQLWFGKMPPVKSVCTMSDFETAGQTAEAMPWSSDAQDVFEKIVYAIRDDLHITLGDRRTRKAVGICQASAAIAGGHEVRPHHLECLRFMFWESPDQIEAVASLVMRESNPDQMILEEFMKEIEAIRNDMPDKASDASPLLIKVKEMNARMAAMQQSRMRDTLLKESRPLETKLLAITTGQSLALVEKLMKAQQNAKAALPPLPV